MSKNISLKNIIEILKEIDLDFPIPLSNKVSIDEYAKKLLENATIKIYKKHNRILGIVAGYTDDINDNIAYISIVGISKSARRSGIASKLLNEFIQECKVKNIRAIHLYTHKTNVNAIKMYNKLGFEQYKINDEIRIEDIHLIKYIE